MTNPRPLPSWLKVTALAKAFGDTRVFAEVHFELEQGQTLAIIGGSGSGKTTLLRILAGLERADSGYLQMYEREISHLSQRQRSALYLYQEPLLFPHLSAFENIAFGLRIQRRSDDAVNLAVRALLAELDLMDCAHRRPDGLSGGQKQRVAFGRAMVVKPALLLLDEPFSSLDPDTRRAMQTLFKRVATEHQITAIFVTHELKEALRMGDRFGMLANGRYTAYADRAQFCADPNTGVAAELRFWQASATELSGPAPVNVDQDHN